MDATTTTTLTSSLSTAMTFLAALSVATERVTEFLKRIPFVSTVLSTKTTGIKEDIRVICVHALAVIIGMVLCHYFPELAPGNIPAAAGAPASVSLGNCFFYGLLASGGSSFWNSALDTFRGVKTKMGG